MSDPNARQFLGISSRNRSLKRSIASLGFSVLTELLLFTGVGALLSSTGLLSTGVTEVAFFDMTISLLFKSLVFQASPKFQTP